MENLNIDTSLLLDGTEKVGDTIWTIQGYSQTITKADKSFITTEVSAYFRNGNMFEDDLAPSAFKRNPFEKEYPKLMEVSNGYDIWHERIVYAEVKGKFWAENHFVEGDVAIWQYAREIQLKQVEFTEEQIKYLESKGVNVEQLKIKK